MPSQTVAGSGLHVLSAFVPVAALVVSQLLVCVNSSPLHTVDAAGLHVLAVHGGAASEATQEPEVHVPLGQLSQLQ